VSRNQTHELTKLVEKNRETDPILQPCANPSLLYSLSVLVWPILEKGVNLPALVRLLSIPLTIIAFTILTIIAFTILTIIAFTILTILTSLIFRPTVATETSHLARTQHLSVATVRIGHTFQAAARATLVGDLFVAGQDVVGVAVNAMAVSPGDKESVAFLRESSWWVGRGAGRRS
jgi:hypothetical protein